MMYFIPLSPEVNFFFVFQIELTMTLSYSNVQINQLIRSLLVKRFDETKRHLDLSYVVFEPGTFKMKPSYFFKLSVPLGHLVFTSQIPVDKTSLNSVIYN